VFVKNTRAGKSHDYHGVIVFKKLSFQNGLCLVSRAFSTEKLRFRDGSVWTVGLARAEIMLRFQCGRGVNRQIGTDSARFIGILI